MGFGAQAEKIASAAEEVGRPIPESCYPPEVDESLTPYIHHFYQLSTCRTMVGPGVPGPIPWTAMDAYAQRMGDSEDEVWYTDFISIMNHLDNVYLQHCAEQAARNGSKSQNLRASDPKARQGSPAASW